MLESIGSAVGKIRDTAWLIQLILRDASGSGLITYKESTHQLSK
jgi:hypothetical protein